MARIDDEPHAARTLLVPLTALPPWTQPMSSSLPAGSSWSSASMGSSFLALGQPAHQYQEEQVRGRIDGSLGQGQ